MTYFEEEISLGDPMSTGYEMGNKNFECKLKFEVE